MEVNSSYIYMHAIVYISSGFTYLFAFISFFFTTGIHLIMGMNIHHLYNNAQIPGLFLIKFLIVIFVVGIFSLIARYVRDKMVNED